MARDAISGYSRKELQQAEARLLARIAAIVDGAPATPDSRPNAVVALARVRAAIERTEPDSHEARLT